jgi:hypothetical protein
MDVVDAVAAAVSVCVFPACGASGSACNGGDACRKVMEGEAAAVVASG